MTGLSLDIFSHQWQARGAAFLVHHGCDIIDDGPVCLRRAVQAGKGSAFELWSLRDLRLPALSGEGTRARGKRRTPISRRDSGGADQQEGFSRCGWWIGWMPAGPRAASSLSAPRALALR